MPALGPRGSVGAAHQRGLLRAALMPFFLGEFDECWIVHAQFTDFAIRGLLRIASLSGK